MSLRLVGTQLSDPGPVGARKPLLVLGPSLGTSVHALWAPCVRRPRRPVPPGRLGPARPRREPRGQRVDDGLRRAGRRGRRSRRRGPGGTGRGDRTVRLRRGLGRRSGRPPAAPRRPGPGARRRDPLQQRGVRRDARLARPSGRRPRQRDGVAGAAVPAAWFTDGFAEREPERGVGAAALAARGGRRELRPGLRGPVPASTSGTVSDEITVPVLAVAGSEDVATPPALLEEIAAGIPGTRLVVLDGVAHLPPAEAPSVVVKLLAAAPRAARGRDHRHTFRPRARGGPAVRAGNGRPPRGPRRRPRRPGERRRHRPDRATSRSSSPSYAWGAHLDPARASTGAAAR